MAKKKAKKKKKAAKKKKGAKKKQHRIVLGVSFGTPNFFCLIGRRIRQFTSVTGL